MGLEIQFLYYFAQYWLMWKCNWGIQFALLLYDLQSGGLKLKKDYFCCFLGLFLRSLFQYYTSPEKLMHEHKNIQQKKIQPKKRGRSQY